MAVGQAVLSSTVLDVAEVDRLSARLEARELSRHSEHAGLLTDALALDAVYRSAGLDLQTTAVLALLWRCSERRAATRLHEARVLDRLGALAAMRSGLLTVEVGRVVVDVLGPVDDETAGGLWTRLHERLEKDVRVGGVLPPARAAELLRRWLLTADPEGATARRRQAEVDSADVQLWRRDDGLVDLALRGLTGPNAQACGQAIREHADPIGLDDQRTAGERLRDAAVDLLLGRTRLPFPTAAVGCGGQGCGCGQGRPVPCGVQVHVLVPLVTARGQADAPAELVGHGPLEPDLLTELLLGAPVLRRVWVDPDTGIPVAADARTWTPPRGDPGAVQALLDQLDTGEPPDRVPMHADDHGPPDSPPRPASPGRPSVLAAPHPVGTPGPYVVPAGLRRLVLVRDPRCTWPGCGRRALTSSGDPGCDLDHDVPWPDGPTCGCNVSPLCRRHHRIKQLGWGKRRTRTGQVRWTSQTGRTWTHHLDHQPVAATRQRPAPPTHDPCAELSDLALVEALWDADPTHPVFDQLDLRPPPHETCPTEPDPGDGYRHGTLWHRLDDPTAWLHIPDGPEPDIGDAPPS